MLRIYRQIVYGQVYLLPSKGLDPNWECVSFLSDMIMAKILPSDETCQFLILLAMVITHRKRNPHQDLIALRSQDPAFHNEGFPLAFRGTLNSEKCRRSSREASCVRFRTLERYNSSRRLFAMKASWVTTEQIL
jgi:hypothetical protein